MSNRLPIYPLSPLNNLDSHNYSVYKKYLSEALRNNRVKNIAITGDFGIGKSSILKTFCRETNSNFMFLSLAEYNNHENNGKNEQLDVFGNSNHNNQNNETNERNKFESSLLRQIISLCHRGKIPLSGLKLVPEEKTKSKRKRLTVLLCIDIVAICFVSFSKNVSEFFHGIFGKDADLHSLHLLLYLVIIILSVFIFGCVFYQFISMTKLKEISASVNSTRSEISATAENTEYCLERNSLELTYIFEMLSKEYDAIVFEDMDRIDHEIAVEILTCLREINNTVNERLRANSENKSFLKKIINIINPLLLEILLRNSFFNFLYREKNKKSLYLRTGKFTRKNLCFIFVINEEMIADFDYNKYIDYGLTIVPELGSENALDIVTALIDELEIIYDNKKLGVAVFRQSYNMPQAFNINILRFLKAEMVVLSFAPFTIAFSKNFFAEKGNTFAVPERFHKIYPFLVTIGLFGACEQLVDSGKNLVSKRNKVIFQGYNAFHVEVILPA